MDVCVVKGKVDVTFLKLRTGEFSVESIRVLDLSREKIYDLGALGLCTSLEILNLSFNDVTRLCGLSTLANLTHLDLAANRIADLEGVHALDNLVYLNVAGNLIMRHSAIACLAMLPHLKTVYFEQMRPVSSTSGDYSGDLQLYTNPICRGVEYKKEIHDLLPNLQNLDGWPTERLEVETGSSTALVSIQEAFSDLDTLVDVKKDISSEGQARNRYLDSLVENVGPWVSNGFWESTRCVSALGSVSETYVDSVDKDLTNVLKQCKKVCEKGKDLVEKTQALLKN